MEQYCFMTKDLHYIKLLYMRICYKNLRSNIWEQGMGRVNISSKIIRQFHPQGFPTIKKKSIENLCVDQSIYAWKKVAVCVQGSARVWYICKYASIAMRNILHFPLFQFRKIQKVRRPGSLLAQKFFRAVLEIYNLDSRQT